MPDAGFVFPPAFRVVTDAIAAVNGGYVEFYVAGTSTPLTVYSDSTLSTSLGSTVYLDSGGHPVSAQGGSTKVVIYTGAALIKMVVKSSAGVTLATYDNVRCAQDTSALSGSGADGAVETIVSKTSDYTILLADDGKLFNCDPTGGTFTLTLPNAATMGAGYEVSLRHAGTTTTNGVKFVTVSGQTIARDNLTTVADTLTGGGETITLVSNGANWVAANHVGARMSHPMPIQVVDRLTAAPSSPNSGAFYIINGTPTGDWLALGFAQHDLVRANGQGGWIRYVPTTDCGWLAFVQDENLNTQFQGSAWVDLSNVTAPTPTAYPNATFEDQKANGTVGGTVTTGAWTARTLNTSVANTITGCSLASNAITLPLPSGYASVTYEVTATAPFYGTETTQLRFKSTTTSKAIYSSQVSIATTGTGGIVTLHGTVTLTATEDFKLEYWAANAAGSTQGLGSVTTDTDVERYARVTIKDVTALQGPRGADGAQGATGPGYYATSTSSLAIGTGSKTFTTQSGLAYAAGMTVKAVDQANSSNWMVGTCTSYSGTTLVLNVTTTNGSGTIAAWNIGLAGEQGATGSPGTTVPDISGLTVLDLFSIAKNDKLIVYDASASAHKAVYPFGMQFVDPTNPKWGVSLTGASDQLAAMQSCVDDVINASTVTEGPVGAILVPGGGILRLDSQLSLRKPLIFICYSFIHYYGTSGSAVVAQDTFPAAGANTGSYVYLAGGRCMAANKNTSEPTSINASGGSFLEIRATQFGRFYIGDVLAFPKYGIWLNSSNDQYRSTVTITEANPGVVSWTAHGRANGDAIRLSTTGTLPTNINASTAYYVVNKTTDTFQLSATQGGSAINTSGSIQSGTHTARGGQHIQDVAIELFGQIAYNGGGIYIQSDDAAAGAAQVCRITGSNPFSNFKNLVIGPSGDNNTNHIVAHLFAMDNPTDTAGNESVEIFGSYNDVHLPYLGTLGTVVYGSGSINNLVKVNLPQSIGWSITDGGTGNTTLFPTADGWAEAVTNKTYTGNVTVNGSINLGHASDTTLARAAAGRATIEGLGVVRGPATPTDNALARFDGTTGDLVQNSLVIVDDSGNVSGMLTLTLPNTGLHILDSNATHDLVIVPGSNLTADRNLTFTTGDADRTVTINGNPTLNDWFDQSVKTTASPTFPLVNFDGTSYLGLSGGTTPIWQMDTNDYYYYDRGGNIFNLTLGGSVRWAADTTGVVNYVPVVTPVGALTLSNGVNSDIAIPTTGYVRITGPTAAFSVTGFAGGVDGRILRLFNSVAFDMTITNDATSTAANRIYTLTGADVTLTGISMATFIYSGNDSRWILCGTQG